MRDLYSHISLGELIPEGDYNADTTPVALDLQGHGSMVIALDIGIGGITFTDANRIDFVLTHSDDDSTYTAVEQSDVQGVTVATGGIVKSLVTAHTAPAVYKIGYKGTGRYLKLLADFSGTHGVKTPLAAIAVLNRPAIGPTS